MTYPKKRSLVVMAFLMLLTGGLYFFYWLYVTKEDINRLGGNIPTFWFAVIPFLNIYFDYHYAYNFMRYIRHESDDFLVLVFCVLLVCLPVIAPFFIQHALNRYTPK